MSRYNSNYVLVFAPKYDELISLLKEEIFQSFWDLISIKGNGDCFEISITQLGRLDYISDFLSEKYPEFLFLEIRSGEVGYRKELITKNSVQKKVTEHFDSVPRRNYTELNKYFETSNNIYTGE